MGVKVLDLTRVLAGPLCTMMLADLGADVIKIERPLRGDDTREWGPPFDERGESAYYLSVNRNKMSVAADLRTARDRDMILGLAREADVVVDNFVPGSLERLGVDTDRLLRENPRLIWCSITGFGASSTRPGYDFVVQAESGWMAVTGEVDGAPMKSGIALSDVIAGKDAAIAILAALHSVARNSPARRHLVISLIDSARAALVNVAQNALVQGTDARRWGNAHPNLVPYQLFAASDRPVVVAAGNDTQWKACVDALGLADLAQDADLQTNRGRLERRERVVRAIGQAIAQRPAAECMRVLSAAGVPCGVVKSALEAIADASSASPLTGMPSPVGGTVRRPPPTLDQDGPMVRQKGWAAFDVTA